MTRRTTLGTWPRLLLLISLTSLGLLLWTARLDQAAPVATTPAAAPKPLADAATYDELLRKASDSQLDGAALVELARNELAALESRLNELAASQGIADWRHAFRSLLQDHPANSEAALRLYRAEIRRANDFLRHHRLISLPANTVRVVEIENPALRQYFSLAMYLEGRLAVTTRAEGQAAAGYLINHCTVCVAPLAVHEVSPGHHVAFHRGPAGEQQRNWRNRNEFFHEGWAFYGELLMLEHGFYTSLAQQFGAWRMVLLRILRAEIDALLHAGQMSEETAIDWYVDKALLSRQAAVSEVDRHLKDPTLKASYLVGALQILDLRQLQAADPAFDLETFHDRLLADRGSVPAVASRAFDITLPPEPASRIAGLTVALPD